MIETNAVTLFADRPGSIRDVIRPLRRNRAFSCGFLHRMYNGRKILAVAQKIIDCDPERDLWLQTSVAKIWCQYLEHWTPLEDGEKYRLHQANLHVRMDIPGNPQPTQVVLLHAEPALTPADFACKCKCGPHIHVVHSKHPMPDCHIPLNLGQLDQVTQSLDEFTVALRHAVDIIKYEVIQRYAIELLGIPAAALSRI